MVQVNAIIHNQLSLILLILNGLIHNDSASDNT